MEAHRTPTQVQELQALEVLVVVDKVVIHQQKVVQEVAIRVAEVAVEHTVLTHLEAMEVQV